MCAVSYDDVRAIAEEIETRPQVISLDPHTVGEVLGDARTLAQATDRKDAAVELVRDAAARIDRSASPCAARAAGPGWPRSSGSTRRSRRATGRRS